MITVPQVVSEIVTRYPFLEDTLERNLINLSALARQIKPEIEERCFKQVEVGSIIMALRRLSVTLQPRKEHKLIFSIPPELIVRSNLFELTIANSPALIDKQRKLSTYFSNKHAYFTTITTGVFETTIIASHDIRQKILELYKNETKISQIDKLSSITIKFPEDIIDVPGVYYTVLKSLAWEGINIAEVVSTYSELTIILNNTAVDRAFPILSKLFVK